MSAVVVLGQLDRARAKAITRKLAGAADLLLDLVVEAYEGRVWEVLGHGSWAEYTAAEVPGLSVIGKGLPVEARREAVAVLRGRGLSLRGVSEVLGIAPNTVRTDAAAAGVVLAEVRGIDGSRRAPVAGPDRAPAPKLTNVARAVLVLREVGEEGIDAVTMAKRLRKDVRSAAALLCRLSKPEDGRAVYRAPARRGQTGSYVLGRVEA